MKRIWFGVVVGIAVVLCIPQVRAQLSKVVRIVDALRVTSNSSWPADGGAGFYNKNGQPAFHYLDMGEVILAGGVPDMGLQGACTLCAITTDGQGRVRTLTSGASGGVPDLGLQGGCSLCTIVTDGQGRVISQSSGVAANTLQDVYDNSPDMGVPLQMAQGKPINVSASDLGTPAINIYQNCGVVVIDTDLGTTNNTCSGAITLINPTVTTSSNSPVQTSPPFSQIVHIWDGAKDVIQAWSWYAEGRTAYSGDLGWWALDATEVVSGIKRNILLIRDQRGNGGLGGETIIGTKSVHNDPAGGGGSDSLCLYPGGGTGVSGGECVTIGGIRMFPSLFSAIRIDVDSNGLNPEGNNATLGSYFTGNNSWTQVEADVVYSARDAVGVGEPDVKVTWFNQNFSSSTNGNPQYSPSVNIGGGSVFNDAASVSDGMKILARVEAYQNAGTQPTVAWVPYAYLDGQVSKGAVPALWYDGVEDLSSLHANQVTIGSSAAKPTCAVGRRGELYTSQGAGGAADVSWQCMKKADDSYAWVQAWTAP